MCTSSDQLDVRIRRAVYANPCEQYVCRFLTRIVFCPVHDKYVHNMKENKIIIIVRVVDVS